MKTLSLMAACAALLVLAAGCETEDAASNNVTISPANVRVRLGETVTFTASGGYEYRWSLSGGDSTNGGGGDAWGDLSTTRGPTTTYTSRQAPTTENVVRTLTVTSFITGSGTGGDSNSTGEVYERTAEAFITHVAPLSVTAPPATAMTSGSTATFTASGGDGGYTWSLASGSLGRLSASSGATVIYTATHSASQTNLQFQTLTVRSGGESQAVTIAQKN